MRRTEDILSKADSLLNENDLLKVNIEKLEKGVRAARV